MKFFDKNPEKELLYAEESLAFNMAEFISEQMKRKDITPLELAICAHVSPWKFSRFLQGRGDLKMREWARVLHIVGTDVVWNLEVPREDNDHE